MKRFRLDDPTILLPGAGRSGEPLARRTSRRAWRGWLRRRRRSNRIPGLWSAIAALAALAALVRLAPDETGPARAFVLLPHLEPVWLLGMAASLGALAMVSGIWRLWTGVTPLRALIGVALGACPLLIAAALLLLRAVASAA
ncbi:MAG: hypothetical protein V3U98_11175 [Acidobacteriota bacterium]